MSIIFNKMAKSLEITVLFLAATPAVAGDIIDFSSTSLLREPRSFFGLDELSMPSTPNSFFPDTPSSNMVSVLSGNIGGHVFGGIAAGSGFDSTGNTVSILGGTIGTSTTGGNVYGGWSYDHYVNNNSVVVKDATVRGIIIGGWVRGGSADVKADGNSVTIGSGATVRDNIYGGYSQGRGEVVGNSILIDGGNVTKNGAIIAGGYSALLTNTVSDNSVTVNSGVINNARIYGGRGQAGSIVTGNIVTVNGGTISNGTIYGGENINGSGQVNQNKVAITGGTVNATIYGGNNSGSGTAINNTVTIGGSAIMNAAYDLYGGYVNSGGGDAFTGNTLNKNNATTVGTVRNFEIVNFGYSGNANMAGLITTPTGSARPGVTLDTDNYNVTFAGAVTGSGDLAKTGTGLLILTSDANNIQNRSVHVEQGTLQLGNGGTTGKITASGGFVVDSDATLAYRHSNNITETQRITGDGKVVQRGTGTLTLNNASNSFTGGTEIESGTLTFFDSYSLNMAKSPTTHAGYITFTGAAGAKYVTLRNTTSSGILLANSFRTQTGAGSNNTVDLTSSPNAWIADVDIADKGGAFYVAGGTAMTVTTNSLVLKGNKANGQRNDLYVEAGGTFNLISGTRTEFESGIDGGGTMNVSSRAPLAGVLLGDSTSTYQMGTTNVTGTSANAVGFVLLSSTSSPIEFKNTNSFSINGNGSFTAAMLAGNGVVQAGNAVNVSNGAVLMPFNGNDPGTFTLRAQTANLTNFGLLYPAFGPQESLISGPMPTSNNALLNIESGPNPVNMQNGTIFIGTTDGNPFKQGDYLIIRSSGGFAGISNDAQLNATLRANVDGFLLPFGSGITPRGTYELRLGDDPDGSGNFVSGTTNVWLSNGLNSLAMAWTGSGGTEAAPVNGDWANGDLFYSVQTRSGNHERQFLPGDKVYISGAGSFKINLPANLSPLGAKIVVSGLVVGQNTDGADTSGGNYTLSGAGGITADKASSFGDYAGSLSETGKLQKYGDSTLTFTNTGGNLFKEGIELYGGMVQFTRANQLDDGGSGIHFIGNSALQALSSVTLSNDIKIADGVTGSLGATGGAALTYTGDLTGSTLAALNKTGTGTVRLETPSSPSAFAGNVTVSSGTLDVAGDFGDTAQFHVKTGAALSGIGTIGALSGGGTIELGGTLKPTGLNLGVPLTVKGDLTFEAGSNLYVRALYSNSDSDLVKVEGGGTVNIDPAANLKVEVDFWSSPRVGNDPITVIDASSVGVVGDPSAKFTLNYYGLPRGYTLEQRGWNGDLFQLGFSYDPNNGFASLPASHNQHEIAKTLDWFVANRDSSIHNLIDRLSDTSWSDREVGKQLDQIHGDLTPNAFFLAFKEPWRHPFNRLSLDSGFILRAVSSHDNDRGGLPRPRAWGELITGRENIRNDGNAHGFRINRYGFALGMDAPLLPRSISGVTFQYTSPRLSQDTGKATADDYEFGLYNMTRLTNLLDLKAYLGYSYQQYDLRRTVSLPASPAGFYGAFFERLNGHTSGNALAASIELTQKIPLRQNIRVLPVVALDFEKAWMRGYKESAGESSLIYNAASMKRAMFRFGLNGELNLQNGLYLKPRIQYAMQLDGQKYPSVGARFTNSTMPNQPKADIWGSRIGRNYWNPGLSGGWKLNNRGDVLLYLNYEAKIYDRATVHAAEVGIMRRW